MVTSIGTEQITGNNEITKRRDDWRLVKFGDVVNNVDISERNPLENGLERYIGLDHIDPESLHIKRWGLIEEGTSFTRKFVAGQVLFGKRRAYQRKVAIAEFDGICSGDILVFEAKNDLLPELLPFIVQSDGFYEHALGTSAGSLSPRTRWRDLADYEFALPPKDEQRRIADILWAVDETVKSLVEVIANLEACEQTAIIDFVNSGSSGIIYGEYSDIQKSRNWQMVQLSKIADISYGLTLNATRRTLSLERPYLRVANVMRGKLDLDEVKDTGCTSEEIIKFVLQEGDVLVVEGHANIDEIGRAALWNGEVPNCLHQNHILRVRSKSKLYPEYLLAYLNSPGGRKYFKYHAKSSSGLNTINSTVLKEMPIPLPSLEQQETFVKVLQEFKSCSQLTNSHLGRTIQLKKFLLDSLLTPQ